MNSPTKSHPGIYLAPAVIALVTAVTFLPALYGELHFDDTRNLVENPHFRGLGWSEISWALTTTYNGHYRPLVWISQSLDYVFWGGLNAFGFHLTNLLIHAANGVLLFFVTQRLIILASPPAGEKQSWHLTLSAAFAALFFSLHPMQTEVVASVTGRKESMAAFFFLWTIWFYLQGRIKAAFCMFVLSLFSKAAALALPIGLLLIDIYPLRRLPCNPRPWFGSNLRPLLWQKVPFVLVAVPFGVLGLLAKDSTGGLHPLHHYGIGERLLQAVFTPSFYFWRTFALYDRITPAFDKSPLAIAVIVIAAVAVIGFYLMRKRFLAPLTCFLFMTVMLFPVLGFGQPGQTAIADRYNYIPCMGWAVLAGKWQHLHQEREAP